MFILIDRQIMGLPRDNWDKSRREDRARRNGTVSIYNDPKPPLKKNNKSGLSVRRVPLPNQRVEQKILDLLKKQKERIYKIRRLKAKRRADKKRLAKERRY